MKSKTVAYVLWLVGIFGVLGFHLFYLGKVGKGVLYIFTAGILGIGAFIDLFTLGNQVETYNVKIRSERTERSLQNTTAALHAQQQAQLRDGKEMI